MAAEAAHATRILFPLRKSIISFLGNIKARVRSIIIYAIIRNANLCKQTIYKEASMQNKTKLQAIGASLLISIMLTGCAERGTQSDDPAAFAKKTYSYSTESKNSPDAVSVKINSDVMWGMGKTVDEVTGKYGSVTAGGNNVYTFENGYGKYVFDDSCKIIGEISARDFLIGDLSNISLDNFASKCGVEVVPLNDNDDPNTMYEGYRQAYYTHPSYKNITFSMLYKESGFDETAKFDIRYNGET